MTFPKNPTNFSGGSIKKKEKKYIVAIRLEEGNQIFEFKTKEDRADFIEDIKKKDSMVEYATAED